MANNAFLGAAVAIPQEDEIVIANTWAASDTIDVTINGKTLTLTVGGATITDILDALVVMLTGSGTMPSGYSSNTTGNLIGEFAALTVTEDGVDTVTVTGESNGRPFTMSVTETTAGDGTATENTTVTPTGPHHFDNADNWSAGTVPVDADDIIFDHRAVASLLFAIDQSAVTPASITVQPSFPADLSIGLPSVNTTKSSYPYDEYLTQELTLGVSTDATNTAVNIYGTGNGRIKINSGDGQATVTINAAGQRASTSEPAIQWRGTHASNVVNVTKGDVGIAFQLGQTATVATLRSGYETNVEGDVNIVCGSGTTLTDLEITGGTVQAEDNISTCAMSGGILDLSGTATMGTLTMRGGGTTYYRSSGTMTTAIAGQGSTLDFRRDNRARTVTNCTLHEGSAYYDPKGTVTHTNGLDLYDCIPKDLRAFEIPRHRTLSLSSI